MTISRSTPTAAADRSLPPRLVDRVTVDRTPQGIIVTCFGPPPPTALDDPAASLVARVALPIEVALALRAALASQLALATASAASEEPSPRVPPGRDGERLGAGDDLPPIRWLAADEGRELFDRQARRLLGMSGEDFIHRWDAGEFTAAYDDPDHPEVMEVASLLPFGR